MGKRRRAAQTVNGGAGGPDVLEATKEALERLSATTSQPQPRDDEQGVIEADLPPITIKGHGMRSKVAEWAMIKAAEPRSTLREQAEKLGMSVDALKIMLYRAKKQGILKFEAPTLVIETEIIPKITRNLQYWLDKKDKTVTIEAAKGLLFPAFRESQGIHETGTTVLALKIEMPPAQPQPELKIVGSGAILGKPKTI